MEQIALGGIPVGIERMIKREGKKKGVNLKKNTIGLLRKSTGTKGKLQKKKYLHHDLDHLCGTWTKREAEEFTENVAFQRRVDEDIRKNEK